MLYVSLILALAAFGMAIYAKLYVSWSRRDPWFFGCAGLIAAALLAAWL